jgi:lysophospholipase L1-like esterase
MLRRALIAIAALSLLVTALSTTASAAAYPASMASTGDSITRAYNTGALFADAPANSWSTGTNATVNSHYSRLLAAGAAITGKNANDAVSGARMIDLDAQMSNALAQGAEYVTVEIGGNDVCRRTVAEMTAVDVFESQFRRAMATLTSNGARTNVRVFVASIPDAYQLWSLLSGNPSARFTWALFGICQALLANPLSKTAADAARRQAVRDRNAAFNEVLGRVCHEYVQCRFDGNVVFGYHVTAAEVSTRDYFHPSLAGQAKLAALTWATLDWGAWHN